MFGYAPVSTASLALALQLDALKTAWCEITYQEQVSGAQERFESAQSVKALREEASLAVWRFYRLGRRLAGVVAIVDGSATRGIAFEFEHGVAFRDQHSTNTAAQ